MPTAETVTEKPTRAFLTKLYAKLKEMAGAAVSQEDFDSAVKHARGHAGGMQKAQNSKAATESLSALISRIQTALYETFRTNYNGGSVFSWAKEVFSDYVIACSNVDGKDYKIPFSLAQNDEIEFGDPVEVETEYVEVSSSTMAHDVADLCANGHGMRLFNELQTYADPPKLIPYLPKPGKYNSPKYGEIVITQERNKNFIANFDNKVYQEKLPVDAEHETKLSGACAWIAGLILNDDDSVDARVEWTDRGTALIEADRFKYFSPEWFEEWTDPVTGETHKDVAVGGALTTRPFFKEKALRPLVASERGLETTETDPKDLPKTQTVIFTALAPVTKEASMAESTATAEKTGAENETTQAAEAQTFAEMQRKLAETEAALKASEEESRKAGERIANLEKESRAKRFTDTIRDAEGSGAKRFMGDEAKHLDFMEKLSEKFGETSDEVKHYVTEQQVHAEQMRAGNLFKEAGRVGAGGDGNSAQAQLEAKAKALQAAEPDKYPTYALAYDYVYQNETELRQQYKEESRGAK